MPDPAEVSAADIARLAGVTRGTVSNWRRRHADFPAARGGTDASPAYDRGEVEAWLADRDMLPALPPDGLLWRAVTTASGDEPLGEVVTRAAHLLFEHADSARATKNIGRAAAGAASGDYEVRRAVTATLAVQAPLDTLEALLDRYAEAVGISATPRRVARLMARLAMAQTGTVFDPAAGTGALLVAALDHNSDIAALGQELDVGLAHLAELNLRIGQSAEQWDGLEVKPGDSLRDDRFPGLEAGAVLCHPPFGSRDWGQEELAADPRWTYGTPPKLEPELAWAQHALAHLRPGGFAALLFPPAVASRPSGRRLRAAMLREGALRAVIALPPGAVRPYHVPVHLWLLARPEGAAPLDPRVLLVDGASLADGIENSSGGTVPGWSSFASLTLAAWRSFTGATPDAEPGPPEDDEWPNEWHDEHRAREHWRIVRAIDLLDEAVDLTPVRHVAPAGPAVPPAQAARHAAKLRAGLRAALTEFVGTLPGGDWPAGVGDRPDAARSPGWRKLPVSHLVSTAMAEYHRERKDASVTVQEGDVLIPAGLTGGASGTGEVRATVAGPDDDGTQLGQHRSLLRPDPAQLDAWFLAGFLMAPGSVQQASYGTSALRIDARRLEIPVLPLADQHRYGEAFRRLRDAENAAARVTGLTAELTALLAEGLTDGTLLPPDNLEPSQSGIRIP